MINTKNILTVDDATTISDNDTLFVGQNSQLKQIDYDLLADAILNKISSKSYSELDTTAKTLIGAIDELNSKSIQSINVASKQTRSFEFTGYAALVQIMRYDTNTYALIALEYWKSEPKILFGSVQESITIVKNNDTNSFSVTNNLNSSVNVMIL